MSSSTVVAVFLMAAVLQSDVIITVNGGPVKCTRHFRHRAIRCLEPYWTLASLYKPTDHRTADSDVLTKQLCLHFEMALVCLHSELTDCPSAVNVKYVQSKLGSDWAVEIRNLCLGQSGTATNRLPGYTSSGADEIFYDMSNGFTEEQANENGHENYQDFRADVPEILIAVPYSDLDSLLENVSSVRKKVTPAARTDPSSAKLRPLYLNIVNVDSSDESKDLINSTTAHSKEGCFALWTVLNLILVIYRHISF